MFLSNSKRKAEPRRFTFTPYYYKEVEKQEIREPERPRIQFKRIRRLQTDSKKSIKVKIVFAIIVGIVLYLYWGLIKDDNRNYDLDEIKIEETPTTFPN